jgi:hypothetical protein
MVKYASWISVAAAVVDRERQHHRYEARHEGETEEPFPRGNSGPEPVRYALTEQYASSLPLADVTKISRRARAAGAADRGPAAGAWLSNCCCLTIELPLFPIVRVTALQLQTEGSAKTHRNQCRAGSRVFALEDISFIATVHCS